MAPGQDVVPGSSNGLYPAGPLSLAPSWATEDRQSLESHRYFSGAGVGLSAPTSLATAGAQSSPRPKTPASSALVRLPRYPPVSVSLTVTLGARAPFDDLEICDATGDSAS
jgi:hypothetical protein